MKLMFTLFLAMFMVACSSGDAGGRAEVVVEETAVAEDETPVETDNARVAFETPEYQCRLTGFNSIKNLSKSCSGTYLSPNVFLTAASCFDILDGGVDLLKNKDREYTVTCRDSESKEVRAVAVHPYYYANSLTEYNGYEVDEINPDTSIITIKYNDMALVWTEKVDITKFPTLPSAMTVKMDFNANDQCTFTGFAIENCDFATGEGCKRVGYESNPIVSVSSCDFGSGDGCFLSSKDSEFSTQANPLAYSVSVKRGGVLADGDVGAGMICKSQEDQPEVIVGLFANKIEDQKKDYALVNVFNKVGFIEKFLLFSEAEFVDNSQTYLLTESYKERAQVGNEITKVFSSVPDMNFSRIYISVDGISDAAAFLAYAQQNQAKVAAYFRANFIKSIHIEEDDRGLFGWAFGYDQVEVGVEGATVSEGQTVFIRGFNKSEWDTLIHR